MNHDPYNMEDINDIVLNRNGNDKSASVKKILTAVAILIILFLIVLIIMKFINRGNIDTNTNLQMPSEAELAKKEQQPKLQPVVIEQKKDEPKVEIKKPEPKPEPQIKTEQDSENKFEIKREDSQPKEQIIEIKKEEPKPEPKKEQIVINEPAKEQIVINQPKAEEPKPEPKKVEPKVEPKKEQPKVEQPKKVEPKPEPKKEQPKVEQPKKVEPKKEEPKKVEPKTEPKPQNGGSPKDVSSLPSGSYIQVHALSQYNPNAASVKKISQKGYTPLAYKSGNLTRLLVGPFKSNDDLNKALQDLRTLNSEAFVYRVK